MDFRAIFKDDENLDKQIRIVLMSYFHNANINNPLKYNFRCNVCGDSKKSQRKKRGYILKYKSPWVYYCHNCGASMTASMWLKNYFPINYKEYVKDSLSKNQYNQPEKYENKMLQYKKQIEESKKTDAEKDREDMRFFVSIIKGQDKIFEIARKQCIDRLIPEDVWKKWYVAIDGTYKNRIIIPFFDDKDSIYYYQGRAIYKIMLPKYLSRRGLEHNNIYNYYLVDRNHPVIVQEGIIDCLFVENSIGMTGLKIDDSKLSYFPKKYFLLDDDKSGNSKAFLLLERGEYVFVWEDFLKNLGIPRKPPKKEKWDINDVCKYINRRDKFTFSELEKYFTNNYYDGVRFK